MSRLRHLVAPFALACAVVAAPAAAQGPATSVGAQLQQQVLHDHLRAQQDAALQSLLHRRNVAAPEGRSTALPPLQLAALGDSIARYDLMQRQNRRWSHSLLAVGAAALAGGFASAAGADAAEISGVQRTLIWGGFGITVLGSQQWKAAARAQAQAEQWRTIHLAASQPQHRSVSHER